MRSKPRLQLLLAAALVAQVAAAPARAQGDPSDPWERTNRGFFKMSMALNYAVLAPVGLVYSKLPKPLRKALRNIARNLGEPVVFVNDVLQGRPKAAARTVGRVAINTTVGVAGMVDVAKHNGLPHHDNDFGLTLGRWGSGPGPYLFLPLLGPSTVRDAFGAGADYGLDPLTYARYNGKTAVTITTAVVDGIGRATESREGLESLSQTSTDLYASIRSFYLQSRAAEISGHSGDVGDLPSFDEAPAPEAPPADPPTPIAPEAAPTPPLPAAPPQS